MTIDLLRAQLVALKAQIDAAIVALDLVDQPDSSPDSSLSTCPHMETVNVGTFQAPEYQCTLCKATVRME